ncbi:MAG: hypothetical protein HGA36_02080 [Candidatus Moranbacteria bacterium]|nr:hypothetical protein [Candidatus Moranbacteria bacterium]
MKTVNSKRIPQEIRKNYSRLCDFLAGAASESGRCSAVMLEPGLGTEEWIKITGKFEDLCIIQAENLNLRFPLSISFQDNGQNNPGQMTHVIAKGSLEQLTNLVILIEK